MGHIAMVFWEKIKILGRKVAQGGASFWSTSPTGQSQGTEDVKYACGATAAQKRARKEEGISRHEEKVWVERGDIGEEVEPMLIMHDDNTA